MAIAGLAMTAMAASADPISVTSGVVDVGGFGRGAFRSITFTLSDGDVFSISGGNADGPSQPVPPCSQFGPCGAGATTNASNTYSVNGAVGSATLNGTYYSTVLYRGSSHFTFTSGDVVLPATTAQTFDLQAPFLLEGLASIWTVGASNTPTFFGDFALTGQGTAIAHFAQFGSGYALSGFTYQVENGTPSPTPEPASLLLLGTGLAAAWQSRRLRHRE